MEGSDNRLPSFNSRLLHITSATLPFQVRDQKRADSEDGEADSTLPEEKVPKSHCKGRGQEAAENKSHCFYWPHRMLS